jgi:hypothetical protein
LVAVKFTHLLNVVVLAGAALAGVKCGDPAPGTTGTGTGGGTTRVVTHRNPDGGMDLGGEGGGTAGW